MENRRVLVAFAIIILGVAGLAYYYSSNRVLDMNRAKTIATGYLDNINDPDIAIDEIMEFQYNFYVIYTEKSTGIGAFEMLIDKESGQIFPEYGPNMMWNLKYGHGGMMGSSDSIPATTVMEPSIALELAQGFLDSAYTGAVADDPHPFYGYYTIHTKLDGEIFGMLSVNQYTGEVWYHNWHGKYIDSIEIG